VQQWYVSESDVFFRGDVRRWLELTQSAYPDDDLLPGGVQTSSDWWHLRDFVEQRPWGLRAHAHLLMSNEHLRRFSLPLLASMHTLLSLGEVVWGEAMAPSVCEAVSSLRCANHTTPAGFPSFLPPHGHAWEELPSMRWYHAPNDPPLVFTGNTLMGNQSHERA